MTLPSAARLRRMFRVTIPRVSRAQKLHDETGDYNISEEALGADEWKGHGSPSTSAGEWEERWLKQRAWAKHARDYDAELLDY